jgi:hypothetical protein
MQAADHDPVAPIHIAQHPAIGEGTVKCGLSIRRLAAKLSSNAEPNK